MNGPKHTGGDTMSPVERALLDAGRSFRTKPDTRARTLAALGVATSAAAVGAAGAAGATSISSLAKLTWTKLLVGATLLGGVAAVPGGYYLMHHRGTATKPGAGHVTMRVNHAGANAMAEPSATADEPAPTSGLRAPAPATPLGPELAAVDAARAALASGDAISALALVGAYERAYPHGRLELEAEVLRMDALAASGHVEAARKHAEAFLRHHGNSVLAARARAYLQPRDPERGPLPPR